jgi:glucokinase
VELCLAIDIGGTKMGAGLVSGDGQVVHDARILTPHTEDPEVLFGALANLVSGVLERERLPARDGRESAVVVCGVGCGGPMSLAEGTVSPLNIPAWRGFPLRDRLACLTGLEVSVDNDAKAFTLGEGWVGVARGKSDFMGMVVSTGVGGGIVLEGRVLEGASGNAGHVGHVIVEPSGRVCGCGAQGCLEAEASGTAIAAATGRPASQAPPEVVERTGKLVGRAVASVSALLDLQLAVVGGSVALGFGAPFFAAANSELQQRAQLSFCRSTRIVPAALGARGPLMGAGAVGWRSTGCQVLGSRT